ncbi:MAG: hypothetical protein M3Z64_10990 [Verrucomicrobiota bacterium]|nr:hypothetical protein [Verrucomicrobiota bacterium]
MKTIRSFFVLFALAFALHNATATTVIPPTFDDLVGRADVIFQGSVTNLKSQFVGEGANRHIATFVTFKVDEQIKGSAGSDYTMQMMGGTVGQETMEVTDGPKFKVGDRDILFVEHNGSQFIPLVGIMHGRFRVQKDQATGRDIVATNDGAPLADVTKLGRDEAAASVGAPLTPQAFKTNVKTQLARLAQ